MMAIPHLLVGAAAAKATRRAWIACPVAFASHFVLDRMPHIDADGIASLVAGYPVDEVAPALADFAVGVALLVWAVRGQSGRRLMIAGAICGLLPDLLGFVPPISTVFHWLPFAAGYDWFHKWCQGDVESRLWPLGVATQVAATAVALAYVVRRARAPGTPAEH
jgi:hypothetical protein